MRSTLYFFFLFLAFTASAQDYFQQHVAYSIDVTLDDQKHELDANLQVTYTNNSPDELSFIWFHLWPNAYREASTAMVQQHMEDGDFDFLYLDEDEKGAIYNLSFTVDDKIAQWEYHPDHIDICKVKLHEPLKPGGKVVIATPFRVKLPSGSISRLGHIGESYQISQWYPKPAVYDKDGWHPIPYLSMGEFYSEFGSFAVSITLPKNYVVGATGDLQEAEEMAWMLNKAKQTKQQIKNGTLVKTKGGAPDNSFPASSVETKTLTYLQDNVHDFAWFADKRWHILSDTVKLPHTGKTVRCWALFTNAEADLWARGVEYISDGLYWYSKWNGDYPYNHCTAVDGTISAGGGMEYPNVTVIGTSGSAKSLETVIVHEVGHNWFYGILGSNERQHPWMDEGLNTLNENRYLETKYPDMGLLDGVIGSNASIQNLARKFRLDIFKNKSLYEFAYLLNARRNYDQPIELPSTEYTQLNYGAMVYSKTGITFDYLKGYLGDDLFDKCMQTYYDRWKFKHPGPDDLRAVFEEITGKDMSWFFDDMIKTTKALDFKALAVKENKDWGDYKVKVKSKGEINGPFAIGGIRGDSVLVYQWYDKVPDDGFVTFPKGDYNKIMIDPKWEIPELKRTNNSVKLKGLFKRTEKFRIQLFGGVEDPYRTTMYVGPAMGWNTHDGFMSGITMYNSIFPRKNFEYALAPMFGWKSKSLAGLGFVAYNANTKHNSIFQNVRAELSGRTFHFSDMVGSVSEPNNYERFVGSLDLELKRKSLRYSPEQHVKLRSIYQTEREDWANPNTVAEANYTITIKKPFYRFDGAGMFRYNQGAQDNQAIYSEIVLNNRFYYGEYRNKIDVRVYTGFFPYKGTTGISPNWAATLSGQNGFYDYTYDNLFLGRDVSRFDFLAQQMVFNQGGFRTFSPIVSDRWLGSINLTVDLPVPLNLALFSDLGMYPVGMVGTQGIEYTTETAFDVGLKIQMLGGLLDIFIPIAYSDAISSYFDLNGYSFWHKIRFDLKLTELNPFKILSSVGN